MKPTSIYSMLVEMSQTHSRLGKGLGYQDLMKFDQRRKKIWNGKTVIVDNGKVVIDKVLDYTELKDVPLLTEEEQQLNIEDVFEKYRASVPNKNTEYTRSNFKAKHLDELTTYEMVNGEPRNKARYELEALVMFKDLSELFANGNWFWQSERFPEFIVFK